MHQYKLEDLIRENNGNLPDPNVLYERKLELVKQCRNLFGIIRVEADTLKEYFYDDTKMLEYLRMLHARFSKLELLLIELEKIKNAYEVRKSDGS